MKGRDVFSTGALGAYELVTVIADAEPYTTFTSVTLAEASKRMRKMFGGDLTDGRELPSEVVVIAWRSLPWVVEGLDRVPEAVLAGSVPNPEVWIVRPKMVGVMLEEA